MSRELANGTLALFDRGGKDQSERSSIAALAACLNCSGVFLNNSVANRKPEAGTVDYTFGGEERIEYLA